MPDASSVVSRSRRYAAGLSTRRLLRSAGFRFAAIYALLLAASAAALALFLWWSTAGLLDRQTVAAIEADAQSLTEHFEAGGLPALVLTIEDRLTQDVEDDAIYLLIDRTGQRITGNLEHWPSGATRNGEWYELPIERAGMRSPTSRPPPPQSPQAISPNV